MQQNSVLNGNCDVSVGVKDPLFSVIPQNMNLNALDYRYTEDNNLSAPVEKGQKLSSLQIWNGPICIAQTETYAMNSVSVAGMDLNDAEKNGKTSVFVIVLCVFGGIFAMILVFFLILFGLRRYRICKTKFQSRRHIRNRRRSL